MSYIPSSIKLAFNPPSPLNISGVIPPTPRLYLLASAPVWAFFKVLENKTYSSPSIFCCLFASLIASPLATFTVSICLVFGFTLDSYVTNPSFCPDSIASVAKYAGSVWYGSIDPGLPESPIALAFLKASAVVLNAAISVGNLLV